MLILAPASVKLENKEGMAFLSKQEEVSDKVLTTWIKCS